MRKCLKIVRGFNNAVVAERKIEFAKTVSKIPLTDDVGRKRKLAFLDVLLEASKDGTVLTDTDIREEVDLFMVAGHDTTTFSAAMTLYLLATFPDHQKKVQEELEEIFGESGRSPTFTDLREMTYLTMAIKESLRLFPSIPAISRKLSQDLQLGNYQIPEQTHVILHIPLLHRDPDSFPEPDKFDPERFSPESDNGRNPYAYVPFSAGPRNCIGQKFAMMEEKVILSTILRSFKVTANVPPDELLLEPSITMKPKNGMYMLFETREKTN